MWLMWCFIFVCGNEKSHFSRVEAKKYQYGYGYEKMPENA
jgi:hypothetical protein